jgi:hypothetical protein
MEQYPQQPMFATAELQFAAMSSLTYLPDGQPGNPDERIDLSTLQSTPGIPASLYSVLSK